MNLRNPLLALAPFALALCACGKTEAPSAEQPAPPAAAPNAPVSGLDLSYFDTAVKPGDDFFHYANGGWVARTEIPADKTSYGVDPMMFDLTEKQLKEIIDAAAKGQNAPGSEAQKVGDLYASYMDEATVETLGLKPLEAEFTRLDALKDKQELPALLAHYLKIGVETPYGLYVHQDAKDSTQYIVDFYQSGLGMPDRDYFLEKDAKFVELRKLYVAHIEKMLALAGVKDAAAQAQAVMALETQIAQKHWNNVDSRDAVKTYNKLTQAELKKLVPGHDFGATLEALAVSVPAVVVSQPSYLSGLGQILGKTSLGTLKNYFRLRLLDGFAGQLNKAVYDEYFAFNRAALYGVKEQRPRWKRGVAMVESAIGEALGKIYVDQYFPAANKQRAEELVQNLLKAYDASFETLSWMSPETQKAAKAKLAKFSYKIGYPNVWRDYSALTISKGDLVGNAMRANEFETQRNLNKLGKPIDRTEWGMTPQTVNAYYNPEQNEIVFPAAQLQGAYFNMAADDAINYGGIGAVIGHEISHGFDDQGSKYDGDGNLKDWWTAEDRRKFETLTKSLIEQYNQYEPVKGFKVNGALTLGENIADLGGLIIAYKAYQISLGGKPAPVIDGMTGDQRFFHGYALSWMTKLREETLINQIKSDPHSPAQFRVNGAVSNVPEFHAAFGLKPGDKLYKAPEQIIKIW